MPAEQLEAMGLNMFGPRPCAIAPALFALPDAQQKAVAGNGMHAAAIGCALLFLLAGVTPVVE